MKKVIVITLFASLSAILFNSCETTGVYEIDDNLVPISANIAYLENNSARYQVDFGQEKLADSLPYLSKSNTGVYSLIYASKGTFLKQKKLTQDLKIWRLGKDGSKILESNIVITAPEKGGTISLLQLSDKSPLSYFNPIPPSSDKTTHTNTQFFYVGANQPNQLKISILAVEYLTFLTTARQDFNNLPIDKKKELPTFTLKKGILSEELALDLNMYKQVNGVPTAFFYKITNPETGEILQNYNKSNKIDLQTATIKTNPKFKCSLFRINYNNATTTTPFNFENFINRYEW
jgi:hypothetical protein